MPEISRNLPNRINLSHQRRITGRPIILGTPNLDARGDLQTGLGSMQSTDVAMLDDTAGRLIDLQNTMPIEENRDPWRTRIFRLGRTRWERMRKSWGNRATFLGQLTDRTLPLSVRIDILRAGRAFTADELITERVRIERNKLIAHHQAQAELCRQRIIRKLTLLGHCDMVQHEGRREIRKEVELGHCDFNQDAYVFYVTSLPRGVKALDISNSDVCTDLSLSVGHPVKSEIKKREADNAVIGLTYTVEIASTMGVPNLCKFSDLLTQIPSTAPALTFLLGYAEGSRLRYIDLERMPHLLGAGETNGGKSNMLHDIICSLVSRNTPDSVRMLMIDLKFQGIELSQYEGLPHLISQHEDSEPGTFIEDVPTGIAVDEAGAMGVLEWAAREAERRGSMFVKGKVRNLREWNSKHQKNRLPHIVVICDELGQLRLAPDETYTKRNYKLLQKLLAQGRAAGVLFIAFTQIASKKVLDQLTKINIPGRICFATPDSASSILVVGDGSARGLMPAGRAIFNHGTTRFLVQTPLILATDIAEVVRNAREGKLTTHVTAQPVTPEEIIEWAVENNESSLAERDVFAHFGELLQRTDRATLRSTLRNMEDREFNVGENRYRVLAGVGVRPRALVQLSGGDTPPLQGKNTGAAHGAQEVCQFCGTPFQAPDARHCASCGAPRKEEEDQAE